MPLTSMLLCVSSARGRGNYFNDKTLSDPTHGHIYSPANPLMTLMTLMTLLYTSICGNCVWNCLTSPLMRSSDIYSSLANVCTPQPYRYPYTWAITHPGAHMHTGQTENIYIYIYMFMWMSMTEICTHARIHGHIYIYIYIYLRVHSTQHTPRT